MLSIREHFQPNIENILEFIGKGFNHYKIPGNLPLYLTRFKGIVQYESLNRELKIKKFYARMWVKNASSISMTKNKLDEFYHHVLSLIEFYINPDFNENEENLKQGMKNLVVCIQILMKMNEVFEYKKIINLEILTDIMKIEGENPNNPYIWAFIGSIFEMIRKALKWKELFIKQYKILISNLEPIIMIIKERIDTYGYYLRQAEALSEIVNTTKILTSNYPEWILGNEESCKFIDAFSHIYTQLDSLYHNLFTMKFKELDKPQPIPDSDSSLKDSGGDNNKNLKTVGTLRISHYINQFKNNFPSLVNSLF